MYGLQKQKVSLRMLDLFGKKVEKQRREQARVIGTVIGVLIRNNRDAAEKKIKQACQLRKEYVETLSKDTFKLWLQKKFDLTEVEAEVINRRATGVD